MIEEEEFFVQALDLPKEERTRFLRESCGADTELLEKVESLLRAHDTEEAMVDSPCNEADLETFYPKDGNELVEDDAPFAPAEGGTIPFGDYLLEEEIARGAMGVVYRAAQTSLKRTVAVKMIRAVVLATEEDVARFRVEAEAAAGLDHPNIVPIYEIGEWEGQQFYSMKLIEGGTLGDQLENFRKDPRSAAALLAKVARAIHAAHQRGILHRDLKPGNILLDEDGEPHVTDFGLAKQMESNSSLTVSGQIMGTPFYMAPEQAEGGSKELTTEADTYSLGAVLYQVITGRLPHQGDSFVGTLKMVVHEEPTAPRSIDPSISRDLETIILKCLAKDPGKRYTSAAGLADDLDRWLAGETVVARPVGTPEKIVKWMKRRPLHAAFWAVTALFFVTLGVGGPIVAFKQAELRKQISAEHDLVVQAGEKEVEARKDAEAISNFFQHILISPRPGQVGGGRNVKVADALEAGAERLETDLADQPARRAELQQRIGMTYHGLGLYPESAAILEKALEIRRELLGSRDERTLHTMVALALAWHNCGRFDEAARLGEEVLTLCRDVLGENHTRTMEASSNLLITYHEMGRSPETILPLRREHLEQCRSLFGLENDHTLDAMHNLAIDCVGAGRHEEALSLLEKVLPLRRKVMGPEHPDTLLSMSSLAANYRMFGRLDEALKLREEVVPLRRKVSGPRHQDTIGAMSSLGFSYLAAGRVEEALALLEQVRELFQETQGPEHPNTLKAMSNLAIARNYAGKVDEAIALQEEALETIRRVLPSNSPQLRAALDNLATCYAKAGRTEEAHRIFAQLGKPQPAPVPPGDARTQEQDSP